MHNIKDERETVSALCHRGYLTAANIQSRSQYSEYHCMYTEIYHKL